MKNIILIFMTGVILILGACKNETTSLDKKKAELAKLLKKQDELAAQIKTLELEIFGMDVNAKSSKPVNVEVSALKKQPFKHFIEVEGTIDGDENIGISTQMPGTINKIFVKEGDVVKKGQVLASLENQSLIKGIEELKNGLEFAKTVYNKQKNLWDQKIGSEIQFLTAKNAKEGLEKKMETLNEQLELTKIKSPIDGTVEEISTKIGQAVSPAYPSFRVVNFNTLKARAELSESYADKVRKGNKVNIVFPDLNRQIESVISFSSKYIDPANRTFSVEADIPNAQDYKPNMIVQLKVIDYAVDSSIVIPVNLIQDSDEGKYVYVAVNENNKLIAKKQFINMGMTYNGFAQILSGLAENDKLIVTGYQDLNNGQFIKL